MKSPALLYYIFFVGGKNKTKWQILNHYLIVNSQLKMETLFVVKLRLRFLS